MTRRVILELLELAKTVNTVEEYKLAIETYLEKDKQQIIDAFEEGVKYGSSTLPQTFDYPASRYYNYTYNDKEEITFYIGILQEDLELLQEDLELLNLHISNEFDDDYYTYTIKGTWDNYNYFLNKPYVKSLTHYEE